MANESEKHGLPKLEQERATRAARVVEAREAVFKALDEYDKAHGSLNWFDGFGAGWKAGRELLVEGMKRIETQPIPPPPPPTAARIAARSRSKGTKDMVLEFITMNPGLRGVEIVKAFGAGDTGAGIPERTVRTALHRLKPDLIFNKDGKWFAVEAKEMK